VCASFAILKSFYNEVEFVVDNQCNPGLIGDCRQVNLNFLLRFALGETISSKTIQT
jgi:hypothetical protein